MYSIQKDFEFDAGHRLTEHKGKCRNIHGHRYKVEVHLESNELDDLGMVVDFFHLGDLKGWIDNNWDHGLVLCDKDVDLIDFCREHGHRYRVVACEPTAENMARILFYVLEGQIKEKELKHVRVKKIVLHETPKCSATFLPER